MSDQNKALIQILDHIKMKLNIFPALMDQGNLEDARYTAQKIKEQLDFVIRKLDDPRDPNTPRDDGPTDAGGCDGAASN